MIIIKIKKLNSIENIKIKNNFSEFTILFNPQGIKYNIYIY